MSHTSQQTEADASVRSTDWLGFRVICPTAPKYARRGYRGTGWFAIVTEDLGDKAVVTYSNGARRTWHKSHLTPLGKPNEVADRRVGESTQTTKGN